MIHRHRMGKVCWNVLLRCQGKTLARYHTAEGNGEILSAVFCFYFFKNAAVLRYWDVWIGPIAFLYQSEISSSKTGGFPTMGGCS